MPRHTNRPTLPGMTDTPFFEPRPEPAVDLDSQEREVDLPWLPPAHVAGVVVPLATDIHHGDDVVVRITQVVAYHRGLELHVGTWVRPGARGDLSAAAGVFGEQEPRIGVRLADGTRLGHQAPHAPVSPDVEHEIDPEIEPATFTQTNATGGGLHFSTSWWVHPFPQGEHLEVVVAWEHQDVPETSVLLDLAPLREQAAREEVLWDPPPPVTDGDSFGWFAYAPMSGSVFTSSPVLSVERPDGERGPEGD